MNKEKWDREFHCGMQYFMDSVREQQAKIKGGAYHDGWLCAKEIAEVKSKHLRKSRERSGLYEIEQPFSQTRRFIIQGKE